MTLFDLIFIAVFLLAVLTLFVAGATAIAGRRVVALRILRVLAVGVGLYLAAVIVVSLLLPREILEVGDDKCYDDWCIGVASSEHASSGSELLYHVTIRLSSRARRVSQRENGIVVYLRDSRGRRFDAVPRSAQVPFNQLLLPQQSILADRIFAVPADAQDVGLVIAHEGGFPIGWFILGGGPFRKEPMVHLP
jgi:hypothetical protein